MNCRYTTGSNGFTKIKFMRGLTVSRLSKEVKNVIRMLFRTTLINEVLIKVLLAAYPALFIRCTACSSLRRTIHFTFTEPVREPKINYS